MKRFIILFLFLSQTYAWSQEPITYEKFTKKFGRTILTRLYWTERLGDSLATGRYTTKINKSYKMVDSSGIELNVIEYTFKDPLYDDFFVKISDKEKEVKKFYNYATFCFISRYDIDKKRSGYVAYYEKVVRNAYLQIVGQENDPNESDLQKFFEAKKFAIVD